jgi:RNA polymerase sigma-70 factor (ECF subfamily)
MSPDSSTNEQPMPDDDDLVVRARTDRAAFGLLYDRYHPAVTRYCVRRLLDRDRAEDVVSDIFLTLAAKLRDFPGRTETEFRRWLFRIATNAVNAYLRQSRRRHELWQTAARRQRERGTDSDASPHRWEKLDWPAVYQAVLELDERAQTIVMLRFFGGLSHDEIADVLEDTPGAVRTTLCRTLARLRERFNPSSSGEGALRTSAKD